MKNESNHVAVLLQKIIPLATLSSAVPQMVERGAKPVIILYPKY